MLQTCPLLWEYELWSYCQKVHTESMAKKSFNEWHPKFNGRYIAVNTQRSMEKIKKFKDLLRRFIQNFSDRLVPVHTHQSRINLDKSRSSKVVWSIMVNYYLKVVTNLQWCFFLFTYYEFEFITCTFNCNWWGNLRSFISQI